jgi:hypothetical protein
VLGERGKAVMKFIQGNQSTMRELEIGKSLFERFGAVSELLIDKSAPLTMQIKSAMSMAMLHVGMFSPIAIDATAEERQSATLEVILEMIPAD